MEIICASCGKLFNMKLADVSNMITANPVFCSPYCLLHLIKDRAFYIKITEARHFKRQKERKLLSDASDADYAAWSDTLQMTFRSDFERVVALYLYKNNVDFWYEQVVLEVETKKYTPDFYLPEAATFLEVKGVWGAGSKAKYKKAVNTIGWYESLILIPWYMKRQFIKELKHGT